MAEGLLLVGVFDVLKPLLAGAALGGAVEEAVGAVVEPPLGGLEADAEAVAAAPAVVVEGGGVDVGADDGPQLAWEGGAAGGAIQPVGVVVGHVVGLLHGHGLGLVADQPAERLLEGGAGDDGVGERGAEARGREGVDPADRADDRGIAAIVGRVGEDPSQQVAAVGVGDHQHVGDLLVLDEGAQLAGEAAGGRGVPHVLLEVAIDDDVIAGVRQAQAHRIHHRGGPVVDEGVGLLAGAVDEGDAGHPRGGRRRGERQGEGEADTEASTEASTEANTEGGGCALTGHEVLLFLPLSL